MGVPATAVNIHVAPEVSNFAVQFTSQLSTTQNKPMKHDKTVYSPVMDLVPYH